MGSDHAGDDAAAGSGKTSTLDSQRAQDETLGMADREKTRLSSFRRFWC
jgi:hypothetical protein